MKKSIYKKYKGGEITTISFNSINRLIKYELKDKLEKVKMCCNTLKPME